MLFFTLLLVPCVSATYKLEETWQGDTFFDNFEYYTGNDPTHGTVDYRGSDASDLAYVNNEGQAIVRADSAAVVEWWKRGRRSIRIESKQSYAAGLFILDAAHIPASVCGSWPAFWSFGKEIRWPAGGEIDVLEYVHKSRENAGTVHTSPGCEAKGNASGILKNRQCGAGGGFQGCGYKDRLGEYAGDAVNEKGGGVYVVEFDFAKKWPVRIWSFHQGEIPSDIADDSPKPWTWKKPFAEFELDDRFCPATKFRSQTFIINTTFCGDWAGGVWGSSGCASSTGFANCADYVRQNPSAFKDTYWTVNHFKIYQWQGGEYPAGTHPAEEPVSCAWNRNAGGHTCGERIEWLKDAKGMSEAESRQQVADEFPEICGSCRQQQGLTAPTPDPTLSPTAGVNCERAWNLPVTDGAGTFTCGARIEWLRDSRGKSDADARQQVAEEFPDICGPCDDGGEMLPMITPSPTESPSPAPTEAMTCERAWNLPVTDGAGTFTCGARIEWLRDNRGKSDADARRQVADEFPDLCGPCGSDTTLVVPAGPPGTGGGGFSVVTQNLFWWNLFGRQGGAKFFEVFGRYKPYDVMLFQECDNVWRIRDGLGLGGEHTVYQARHALAITWNKNRFKELRRGFRDVAVDRADQFYGSRGVAWVRLQDRTNGEKYWIGSHHGPLPINTGGALGGGVVAANVIRLMKEESQSDDRVILAGDFNADSGSRTVRELKEAGLDLRASDWVDHVFTRDLGVVVQSTIIRGTGSDHRGIKVEFS